MKKKIVFITGAGISAESGISTFRDSDGLWEKYPVQVVASIEGYHRDPELVINFYNERRKQLLDCKPNGAHLLVAELEKMYDVTVVTQNGRNNGYFLDDVFDISAYHSLDPSPYQPNSGHDFSYGVEYIIPYI